jgi:hypothetical protein
MAVLYLIMGLCFVPFFLLVSATVPPESEQALGFPMGTSFLLVMPFIYAVFGFVFTLIGAALYNLVAGFIGGIELDLDTVVAGAGDFPTA